jgi:hypothetical protein
MLPLEGYCRKTYFTFLTSLASMNFVLDTPLVVTQDLRSRVRLRYLITLLGLHGVYPLRAIGAQLPALAFGVVVGLRNIRP